MMTAPATAADNNIRAMLPVLRESLRGVLMKLQEEQLRIAASNPSEHLSRVSLHEWTQALPMRFLMARLSRQLRQ